MEFRPCIDLRNGKVTQIVGSTLCDGVGASVSCDVTDKTPDEDKQKQLPDAADAADADTAVEQASPSTEDIASDQACQSTEQVRETPDAKRHKAAPKEVTNFVATKAQTPAHYAAMYQRDQLRGGHVIMLGPGNEEAALSALRTFPGGMQVGGGITPANAKKYLDAGASHVIVTSYVFKNGKIDLGRLKQLVETVGKQRLVLDISCRRKVKGGSYFVVTDRWQKYTDYALSQTTISELAGFCAEFLVHGVDVEGKMQGVEGELIALLGDWCSTTGTPVTYAGGVRNFEDLALVNELGKGRVHVTVGSALDIFGGALPYSDVVSFTRSRCGLTKEPTLVV